MKENSRKLKTKRHRVARWVLTWTLITLGIFLVVGTILDFAAFSILKSFKVDINHFTSLLFTSCVGLLCFVLGLERKIDLDKIESTLEKQNETLEIQDKYLEKSTNKLTELFSVIQESIEVSKGLFHKVDELKSKMELPSVLKDINWRRLITRSDQIDFLVQGWDGWMVDHSEQLEEFFKKGGEFNLFVINGEDPDSEYIRELMQKRLNKTKQQVEVEIQNTIMYIKSAFDTATADDSFPEKKLDIFKINQINWYFAAQFKSKDSMGSDALVLSFYSHYQYYLKDTPAIVLYRDSAENVFKWFEIELRKLKEQSKK